MNLPTSSPLLRLALLCALMLVLLIPLSMINGVVDDRAARRAEAEASITADWGGAQTLVGPVLHVTCVYAPPPADAKGWTPEPRRESMYLMPERLDVAGTLEHQVRHRGIFGVPVYAAALTLKGSFARPELAQCLDHAASIDATQTELIVGLTEPRSLRAESSIEWNGERRELKPSTGVAQAPLRFGVHAPLPEVFGAEHASFTLHLAFNGSQTLQLAPVAKETTATLQSSWPHPGFMGASLPIAHDESDAGFRANWSISYLGRDFAQAWTTPADQAEAVQRSLFGVTLTTPADPYVQAQRICRYASLTLLFTFGTLWLTETLAGVRLHPIQYGFVGAALCLFSLLQISFAEHFGFDAAFAVATLGVIGQVALYCRALLGSTRRTFVVAAVLGGLYGYLYAILIAEDYALLGGSLALFAMLSTAMYLTRNVDWSGLTPAPGSRTP